MKKKLVLFMLVGMGLVSTSCGNAAAEVETGQVSVTEAAEEETENLSETEVDAEEETENQSETEVATEKETENLSVTEEAENTEVQGEDSVENKEVTLDETKIEQMLNDTLNWLGLQYTYVENPDVKELTAAQAIPMAYHAVGVTQTSLEEDEEYNLIVPENLLEEAMKNLFGKVYDTSEYTPVEYDMVRQAEDGSLRLRQGDWGTARPSFSIEGIEKDTSSNGFIATVNYFTYDIAEGSNSETEYVVHYYLEPNEESVYRFVITNMVGEKTSASIE